MGREREISQQQPDQPVQEGGVSLYDQAVGGDPGARIAQTGQDERQTTVQERQTTAQNGSGETNFYDKQYNELPDRGAQMPPDGQRQEIARVGGQASDADCAWRPNPNSQSERTQQWFRASQERMGLPIELNANGDYNVVFGDSLGAVAMRNLKMVNAPASSEAIKAEVARLAAMNKDRYPSLDCNYDLIKEGWQLRITPPGGGRVDTPQGPPRERPPEQLPPRELPPERPPEHGRKRGNTVNIYHIDADTVTIDGGANGGVPIGRDGPRQPVQREPIEPPVRYEQPPVRYEEPPVRYDRPQGRVGYEEPGYTRIVIGGSNYGNDRYQDPRMYQDPRYQYQDPRYGYQDPRYRYQDPRYAYDPGFQDPRYLFQDPRIAQRNPAAYRQDPWAYAANDGQQWYRNYEYSQDPRYAQATQRYQDPRLMDPRYQDPRMDPRLAYRYGRQQQQPYYDPNCPPGQQRRRGGGAGRNGSYIQIG